MYVGLSVLIQRFFAMITKSREAKTHYSLSLFSFHIKITNTQRYIFFIVTKKHIKKRTKTRFKRQRKRFMNI